MQEKLGSIVGVGIVILIFFGPLFAGLNFLGTKIETGINKIWPAYETRAERKQEEVKIVKKTFCICRIMEIQFSANAKLNKDWRVGEITYLLDRGEKAATKEFLVYKKGWLSLKGDQTVSIPYEEIKKIRFETVPIATLNKWTRNFERTTIPKIRMEVEYLNGTVAHYSVYATQWINFF